MKNCFRKTVERSAVFAILAACSGLPGVTLAQSGGALEEVVVTGYKASLQAALDIKKESTGAVDAIMSEDIADFPDLNLAESLQRIPGVAITRNNGEGQRITVRGLSGEYTRVRINGMESRASVGTNNTRSFDFDIFASELFNSIVVHKTAKATIEEGSIGATVDLNTSRPFDMDDGHTFLVSAQLQNNDLAGETDPRVAALYAYNGGTWGLTASIATSDLTNELRSSNTVRWQKSVFNSVGGIACPTEAAIAGGTPAVPGCDAVADAFHARIPRYVDAVLTRERTGATLGLQFQPSDSTLISFDALIAQYDATNTNSPIEVLFRGNEGGMDVTNYVIQAGPAGSVRGTSARLPNSNNTVIAMDVDNAWVRSEAFYGESESDFSQFNLNLEQDFSDSLRMDVLVGKADAKGHLPVNTTLMFDNRTYDGFSYDYRTGNESPTLIYGGLDVTDGSIFQLTDLRDQVHTTETSNSTFDVNLEWDFADSTTLKTGISQKKFEMTTRQDRRDGTACALLTGGAGCAPGNYGIPMTQALSTITTYGGPAGPGSTKRWASPNIAAIDAAYGYYSVPLSIDFGRHADVEETNTGLFVQLAGEKSSGDLRFQYDIGVRYVETDQTSGGYNTGVWVSVDRPKYSDTLPSANAALWFNDEVVLRMSYADTLSRPTLSQLSPGGNINSFSDRSINYQNPMLDPSRASNMDVSLEWYFDEGAVIGWSFFTKNLDSFAIRELSTDVTYASSGLPYSLIDPTSPWINMPEGGPQEPCNPANGGTGCWDISRLVNGPGADIKGWELAFQAPFDVLFGASGILGDMGINANYTRVNSEVLYAFSGSAAFDEIEANLNGLSNDQWNLTLYYEGDRFSTRASWAYRSDYLNSSANRNGNLFQVVKAATYLDLSASYDVTDAFSLSLEVVNALDEPYVQVVDQDANRLMQTDVTGTNVLLGARYKF